MSVRKKVSPKTKFIQVCPKCGASYRPGKTLTNVFGVFAFGFKCKSCNYQGPGPIKISQDDYKKFLRELKSKSSKAG